MTNIRCKGGKEIDLLAIDPIREGQRYHVESRVSTTHLLRLEATYTKKGVCYKNGVYYFAKEKFDHSMVLEKVRTLFGEKEYFRVLVVYDLYKPRNKKLFLEQATQKFGINIWFIIDIIEELKMHGRMKGSRDDILRTVELIYASERQSERHERALRKAFHFQAILPKHPE